MMDTILGVESMDVNRQKWQGCTEFSIIWGGFANDGLKWL